MVVSHTPCALYKRHWQPHVFIFSTDILLNNWTTERFIQEVHKQLLNADFVTSWQNKFRGKLRLFSSLWLVGNRLIQDPSTPNITTSPPGGNGIYSKETNQSL